MYPRSLCSVKRRKTGYKVVSLEPSRKAYAGMASLYFSWLSLPISISVKYLVNVVEGSTTDSADLESISGQSCPRRTILQFVTRYS